MVDWVGPEEEITRYQNTKRRWIFREKSYEFFAYPRIERTLRFVPAKFASLHSLRIIWILLKNKFSCKNKMFQNYKQPSTVNKAS